MIEVFRKALMEAHHDDWDMETVSDAAHICADALRGFLVAKIPDCNRMDHPHGRHSLITRTASCPGKEPLPHGFANGHFGFVRLDRFLRMWRVVPRLHLQKKRAAELR